MASNKVLDSTADEVETRKPSCSASGLPTHSLRARPAGKSPRNGPVPPLAPRARGRPSPKLEASALSSPATAPPAAERSPPNGPTRPPARSSTARPVESGSSAQRHPLARFSDCWGGPSRPRFS